MNYLYKVLELTVLPADMSIQANTPNRQRPKRKTSPWKHLTNEIQWMSESVTKIERMIKDGDNEIDAIKEREILLLKENEAKMISAKRRKDELIELKKYLLAWGAQDEKVTAEWSPSK